MTCQHPHCTTPAKFMVGYRKWCGIVVNVQACCTKHKRAGRAMVDSILGSHPAGYATPFSEAIKKKGL